MKTRGTDPDPGGVHPQADPEGRPGYLQLAEVGYFLGGGGVLAGQKVFANEFKMEKSVFAALNSVVFPFTR